MTQNTLGRKRISGDDIDKWKNKNWDTVWLMATEARMKEYSLLKRIITAIIEQREKEESNVVVSTQKELSEKIDQKPPEVTQEESSNKTYRASHPDSGESPPSKMKKTGEGRET